MARTASSIARLKRNSVSRLIIRTSRGESAPPVSCDASIALSFGAARAQDAVDQRIAFLGQLAASDEEPVLPRPASFAMHFGHCPDRLGAKPTDRTFRRYAPKIFMFCRALGPVLVHCAASPPGSVRRPGLLTPSFFRRSNRGAGSAHFGLQASPAYCCAWSWGCCPRRHDHPRPDR